MKYRMENFRMLKPKITVDTVEPPLTLATVAPEWVKLSTRYQELCALEEELLAKARGQKKNLDGSGLALFSEQNILPIRAAAADADKPPRMVGASKKAAALLGSEYTPDPTPAIPHLAHEPKIAKEARELTIEIAAVREAITLLLPQLEKAHRDGSARLCELLMPEYNIIARRACAALIALGLAEIEHQDFMRRHRSAARSTLRPIQTGALGDPLDPESKLRILLDWAIEVKHLDAADLPPGWNRRPGGNVRFWPDANARGY
jgi:hypothetical protein